MRAYCISRLVLVSAMFLFAVANAKSQETSLSRGDNDVNQSKPSNAQFSINYATVYFLRTPYKGFHQGPINHPLSAYNIFVDTTWICTLNDGEYTISKVSAGLHYFSAKYMGKKEKTDSAGTLIRIEPRKSFYIQLVVDASEGSHKMTCHVIHEDLAELMLPDMKHDPSCEEDQKDKIY